MAADRLPEAQVRVYDPTRGRFGNARRIEICRPAVDDGLDHISHYTTGGLNFSIDALAEPRDANASGWGSSPLAGLGRQLTGRFIELDRAVRHWRSGALIRLVVQGAERLIVCNSVTADQLLISSAPMVAPGLPLEPDRRAAQLVDELRALIALLSQNPGGFRTAGPGERPGDGADRDDAPEEGPGSAAGIDGPEQHEKAWLDVWGGPTAAVRAVSAAVDPADLHYAGYIRGGIWQCAANVFDHPRLDAYFGPEITVDNRRSHYRDFGSMLCVGPESLLGQFTLDLEDQIGEVRRIVLDVEQGAFYCYRLGDDDFVLGVTLAQNQVQKADEKIEHLATAIGGRDEE